MTQRVMIVFGTRPEAIKMAPVALALRADPAFETIVCVTAQHRQMLDQVMQIFQLRADVDLDVMSPGQDLYDITSRILLGMRDVLRQLRPDLVLVHGDTTTCFAATLAAFYQNIPVGHVEAGLRTGNLAAPFPEEANRALVGRLARYHFAPTQQARTNLLAEAVPADHIFVTGNSVIDALLLARAASADMAGWHGALSEALIAQIQSRSGPLVLITGHRRENFGQGFIDLCTAIRTLAAAHPQWLFIYPVHLNPNVQAPVRALLGDVPNIQLIEPLEYLPFVWLMDHCDLILTDSGGIQEEGPALGKPVLVMRDVTERPEAVAAGTVKLVGTSIERITATVEAVLTDRSLYQSMSTASNPYGDGHAAQRIVRILKQNADPADAGDAAPSPIENLRELSYGR